MMELMFQLNPMHRPLAFEILKEPFFKNCNLGAVRITHGNLNLGISPSPNQGKKSK